MSGAAVRIPLPAHGAGRGTSMIDVRFCDGPAGLEPALAGAERVAVIGGPAELGPAASHSLDAVVLAARPAAGHARGLLLGEVGRVLRSGGRLVVIAPVPV